MGPLFLGGGKKKEQTKGKIKGKLKVDWDSQCSAFRGGPMSREIFLAAVDAGVETDKGQRRVWAPCLTRWGDGAPPKWLPFGLPQNNPFKRVPSN